MRTMRPLLALLLAAFTVAVAFADELREITEHHPSGAIRAKYTVDAEGRRHGNSIEYHENGRARVRCGYRAGTLHGNFSSYYPSGKRHVSAKYKDGKLDGRYRERGPDGKVLFLGEARTFYVTAPVVASTVFDRGPLERALRAADPSDPSPVEVVDEASGKAKILTYTVLYDREGDPKRGIVIGELESGPRFIANTPDDRARLEDLVSREAVGRSGTVASIDALNRFIPS